MVNYINLAKFAWDNRTEIAKRTFDSDAMYEGVCRDQRKNFETYMTRSPVYALLSLDPEGKSYKRDPETGEILYDRDTGEALEEKNVPASEKVDSDIAEQYDFDSNWSFNFVPKNEDRFDAAGEKDNRARYNMRDSLEQMLDSLDNATNDSLSADQRIDWFEHFKTNMGYFEDEIDRLEESFDDIFANPSLTDRMVGGTIVARLAAHEALPHFQKIKDARAKILEISSTKHSEAEAAAANEEIKKLIKEAQEAQIQCAEELAKATVIKPSIGQGEWAGTQAMLQQDVGRVERDITDADRQRYMELIDDGGHKGIMPLPDLATRKIYGTYGDLDYSPVPDMHFRMPYGQNFGWSWTNPFRFMCIYPQVKAALAEIDKAKDPQGYKAALEKINEDLIVNGKELLDSENSNAFMYGMHRMAMQYSTNRDADGDGNPDADRNGGINDLLVKQANKGELDDIFPPEIVELIPHMFKVQVATGPNEQRQRRAEAHALLYRHQIASGDHDNELHHQAGNEHVLAMKDKWGTGIPFLPGPYLNAKGTPYRQFTMKVAKPLSTTWKLIGGKHALGKTLGWSWRNKGKTALAGAGMFGYTAIANPPLALALAGTAFNATWATGAAIVPWIPTVVSGVATGVAFMATPMGMAVGAAAIGGLVFRGNIYDALKPKPTEMSKEDKKEAFKEEKEEVPLQKRKPPSKKTAKIEPRMDSVLPDISAAFDQTTGPGSGEITVTPGSLGENFKSVADLLTKIGHRVEQLEARLGA